MRAEEESDSHLNDTGFMTAQNNSWLRYVVSGISDHKRPSLPKEPGILQRQRAIISSSIAESMTSRRRISKSLITVRCSMPRQSAVSGVSGIVSYGMHTGSFF
jgi:hypothetical protein